MCQIDSNVDGTQWGDANSIANRSKNINRKILISTWNYTRGRKVFMGELFWISQIFLWVIVPY